MGHLLRGIITLLFTFFCIFTLGSGSAYAAALPIMAPGCKYVSGKIYCPSSSAPPADSSYHGFQPYLHGMKESSAPPTSTDLNNPESPRVIPRDLGDLACATTDPTLKSSVLESKAMDDFCESTKDAFAALLNGCLSDDLSGDEHGGAITDDAWLYSITLNPTAKKARFAELPSIENDNEDESNLSNSAGSATKESAIVRNPSRGVSPLVAPQGKNTYESFHCDTGKTTIPRADIERMTNNYCRDAARNLNMDVTNYIVYSIGNVDVKVTVVFKGKKGSASTSSLDEGACNRALFELFQHCEVGDTQNGGWVHDVDADIWYYVVTWTTSNRTRDVEPFAIEAGTNNARGNGYGTPTCTPGDIISKSDLNKNAVNSFCVNTNGIDLTPELGFVESTYTVNDLPVRIRATALNNVQSFLEKGQCTKTINHMLDTCDKGGAGALNKYDMMYQVFINPPPALRAHDDGFSTPRCYTSGTTVANSDIEQYAVKPFCAKMNNLDLTTSLAHPESSYTVNDCPVRIRANRLNLRDTWLEAGDCERTIDLMLGNCTQGGGGEIAHSNVGYMVFVG